MNGILTLMSSGIFLALVGVIFKAGKILHTLECLERDVRDDLKPDIKEMRDRLISVEDKVAVLWEDRVAPAHSPRKLNAKGQSILRQSGVDQIVETYLPGLVRDVRQQGPENAYQAERATVDAVNQLKDDPEILAQLENGAFATGTTVDEVLFVGAIYIRDKVLTELGFDGEAIDGQAGL